MATAAADGVVLCIYFLTFSLLESKRPDWCNHHLMVYILCIDKTQTLRLKSIGKIDDINVYWDVILDGGLPRRRVPLYFLLKRS